MSLKYTFLDTHHDRDHDSTIQTRQQFDTSVFKVVPVHALGPNLHPHSFLRRRGSSEVNLIIMIFLLRQPKLSEHDVSLPIRRDRDCVKAFCL